MSVSIHNLQQRNEWVNLYTWRPYIIQCYQANLFLFLTWHLQTNRILILNKSYGTIAGWGSWHIKFGYPKWYSPRGLCTRKQRSVKYSISVPNISSIQISWNPVCPHFFLNYPIILNFYKAVSWLCFVQNSKTIGQLERVWWTDAVSQDLSWSCVSDGCSILHKAPATN